MPRDTDLARRLRKQGLKVVEVAGWKTRGKTSFNPRGGVNHHTAGSSRGNAPSLRLCINGRTGVPGPLCHVLLARDNTAYLIAAGRANHAGRGGWRGLSGNSSVYGLEVEHTGYTSGPRAEGLSPARYDAMVKVQAAFADGKYDPARMVCQHYEWAPSRKIDFVRGTSPKRVDPDQFRRDVKARLAGDEDLTPEQNKMLEDLHKYVVTGPVPYGFQTTTMAANLAAMAVTGDEGDDFRYDLRGYIKGWALADRRFYTRDHDRVVALFAEILKEEIAKAQSETSG